MAGRLPQTARRSPGCCQPYPRRIGAAVLLSLAVPTTNKQQESQGLVGFFRRAPRGWPFARAACFLQQGGARTARASVLPCLPHPKVWTVWTWLSRFQLFTDRFGPRVAGRSLPAIEESCSPHCKPESSWTSRDLPAPLNLLASPQAPFRRGSMASSRALQPQGLLVVFRGRLSPGPTLHPASL
jgi:hypothetical protein